MVLIMLIMATVNVFEDSDDYNGCHANDEDDGGNDDHDHCDNAIMMITQKALPLA